MTYIENEKGQIPSVSFDTNSIDASEYLRYKPENPYMDFTSGKYSDEFVEWYIGYIQSLDRIDCYPSPSMDLIFWLQGNKLKSRSN